jgi:hypothetical protein
MQSRHLLLLGWLALGLASCSKPAASPAHTTGTPTQPGAPAAAGKPKELILGRWDPVKDTGKRIEWGFMPGNTADKPRYPLQFKERGAVPFLADQVDGAAPVIIENIHHQRIHYYKFLDDDTVQVTEYISGLFNDRDKAAPPPSPEGSS